MLLRKDCDYLSISGDPFLIADFPYTLVSFIQILYRFV